MPSRLNECPLPCLQAPFGKEASPPSDDEDSEWWSHGLPLSAFSQELLLDHSKNLLSFSEPQFQLYRMGVVLSTCYTRCSSKSWIWNNCFHPPNSACHHLLHFVAFLPWLLLLLTTISTTTTITNTYLGEKKDYAKDCDTCPFNIWKHFNPTEFYNRILLDSLKQICHVSLSRISKPTCLTW